MAGQVKHVKLFSGVAPDAMLLSVLRRLPAANTDALIAAVAGVLEENGITLMDSTALLADLMAQPGVLTTAAPDDGDARRLRVRVSRRRRASPVSTSDRPSS